MGIELELHLVDRASGALVPRATELLDELGAAHPGGEHPKAKHELFESTIEIITGVCRSPAEAAEDLAATLAEVRTATAPRGLTLVSSGTHPFSTAREQVVSPSPRYHELIESMQWPAKRLLICGMHVHVGLPDGPAAIAVVNELRRHLGLFLALSASSPYFEGEDTGLASARSKVFEGLPTAGLPPSLGSWEDFEAFMDTLLAARCISSIREVWWDVRPHPDFGTVELRICDAPPTLREAVALAALAQALVAWSLDRLRDGTLPAPPREWTVRENRWLAARFGTDAELIVDESGRRVHVARLAAELIERLTPTARRLGSTAALDDVARILDTGAGYARERRVVERGGSLADVVATLERELAADRPETP
jgi:carboxylate-amine ligase